MHNTLDQNIWNDEELRVDVRNSLLKIANSFLENTETEIEPEDIIFVGSVAGYTYGPTSDIDLHIVIDMSKLSEDVDLASAFFNAEKVNWNSKHNITVRGRDVEIYVQDVSEKLESAAIFSVLNNEWIKKQPKTMGEVPPSSEARIREILTIWKSEALKQLSVNKAEGIEKAINLIYQIRRRGLERGGELDPMNLAFKKVRSAGILDKLKDARTSEEDKSLSLEDFNPEGVYKQRDMIYTSDMISEQNLNEFAKLSDEDLFNLEVKNFILKTGLVDMPPVTPAMTADQVLAKLGIKK
jgi:predicted nucleotidyltransferase